MGRRGMEGKRELLRVGVAGGRAVEARLGAAEVAWEDVRGVCDAEEFAFVGVVVALLGVCVGLGGPAEDGLEESGLWHRPLGCRREVLGEKAPKAGAYKRRARRRMARERRRARPRRRSQLPPARPAPHHYPRQFPACPSASLMTPPSDVVALARDQPI
ncbi:hypothetical protein BC628DRAFT_1121207 [Trametes gibbosa]|nr:hypothetical protein BC628DRAFT_1121207 [Trametes gibbosa]